MSPALFCPSCFCPNSRVCSSLSLHTPNHNKQMNSIMDSAPALHQAGVSDFERALDSIAQAPELLEMDTAAEAENPVTTTTIIKKSGESTGPIHVVHMHKGKQTAKITHHEGTATIIHGEPADDGAAEESGAEESGSEDAEDSEGSEGSEGSEDSEGSEGSEDGDEESGDDEDEPPKKRVITTTTTVITRHRVPDKAGEEKAATGSESSTESSAAEASSEESKEAEEAKTEKAEETAEEKKAEASEESSESAGKKKCSKNSRLLTSHGVNLRVSGANDEEDCEEGDPILTQKKAKISALEHTMAAEQKKYEEEHDWMMKATHLINQLGEKSNNVRLHLHDLHKNIVKINLRKKQLQNEVDHMERQHEANERVRLISSQLNKLMEHADATRAEMAALAAKRSNFLSKVADLKGVLQDLKGQAIASRAMANPMGIYTQGASMQLNDCEGTQC